MNTSLQIIEISFLLFQVLHLFLIFQYLVFSFEFAFPPFSGYNCFEKYSMKIHGKCRDYEKRGQRRRTAAGRGEPRVRSLSAASF